jgi:UDP-3-O-[3-hydroxymyristoyl] glucosamine N-acyltransferase
MELRADEIARQLEGEVIGDPGLILQGFAPADKSRPGDLTFAENATYYARANQSPASAIVVDHDYGPSAKTLIRVLSARVAFARILPLFHPEPVHVPGVHPSSVIAPTAVVDPSASIGPHCVIADQARIGPRCVLHGANHVGPGCVLGAECHLFPRVVLYPAPNSAIACASTPGQWWAPMGSVMCSTKGTTGRSPRWGRWSSTTTSRSGPMLPSTAGR